MHTHINSHILVLPFSISKVVLGKPLSSTAGGVTLQSLKQEGSEAVFVGIGLPDPKKIPLFEGLTQEKGFFTSKDFLPRVASASKAGKLPYNTYIYKAL